MRTWNLDGLRKHAKAKGESVKASRAKRGSKKPFAPDPTCVCGYKESSHDPRHPQYEHYRREGMCADFQLAGLITDKK